MIQKKDALFQNGTSWIRADFHLHTQADKEFSYEGDPDYFVSDYVEALKKEDIRVGVITNHNKFNADEYRVLSRHARRNEILLLPGVELSVNDGAAGVHVLIVFSEEWVKGGDHINPLLASAFPGRTPQEYENRNAHCDWDITQTIAEVEKRNKDFFLIFAHVEDPKGLWKELDISRLKSLASNESFRRRNLGFQQVRTRDLAESGRLCRRKVKEAMGDAYPAEVEGSDCKSIDQIGAKKDTTYIKIGEPSFDAVKYALMDFPHRVDTTPPDIRHSYIRSVSFTGGVLDGKTVSFSPELNTLIGIRGSGKSSIIEAIRYALDIPITSRLDASYKEKLVEYVMGSGGKVVVEAIDRHAQPYEISRILKQAPDIWLNGERRPGISIRDAIIQRPIYFGQKDLSHSGSDEKFEADLVEKLIGDDLRSIAERIDEQRQKVSSIVQRLDSLTQAHDKKSEYELQQKNAKHRLEFFAKHGVEEKLQRQVNFDKDILRAEQMVALAKQFSDSLVEVVGHYEDDLRNYATYTSKENDEFFATFLDLYISLDKVLEKVRQGAQEARNTEYSLRKKAEELKTVKYSLKEEFAAIERSLAEHFREAGQVTIRPEEFMELKNKLTHAEDMLARLSKEAEQQSLLDDELEEELAKLDDLWHEEFTSIKKELERINKSDVLEIIVEYKGDKEAFVSYMKENFRGSGIRETAYRNLVDKYPDFRALYNDLEEAAGLITGAAPHVFKDYFMKNRSALLTWKVPNRFVIKYRGKELKEHSLGQRASALLLFVLNQGDNDVVIIDQPEDDLDNQTIYEDVIKLLRDLKSGAQFIFATHNANIPVLGDAEQVIRCAYQDGDIDVKSGSIDSAFMQQEVVDIMEGGEEAFQRRKRIYEIWNP